MRYRFDRFELDVARRALTGPDGPVPLQPRAMSVLVRLIEQRHRVVRSGELLETVWAGEIVTDASVRQAVRSIRRALGDEDAIRTVARQGYQFVATVAGDERRARRLVGRDAELGELRAALDTATRGAARLVLIEGEAGIGKSTLLHAFAESLRGYAVAVALGSTHPQEDAPPFWPWIRALRELEALRPSARPIAGSLEAADGAAHDRYRRFDAVRAWLGERAADDTVCLLFEDLHWADASTLQLLQFVVRESVRPRLLVVATWRSWHGPERALAELRAGTRTRSLRLRGLDRDATAALTGLRGPQVDEILALTGGNPLFVTELVRQRAEHPSAAGAPPTVRAVLGERVARLDARARRLLDVAAVLGDVADAALLGELAGEADPVAVLGPTGLVRAEGGRAVFSHALVREHLYDELDPDARARLHAAAADALERRQTSEPGRWTDAVSFHAWRAGTSADARRTLARCLAAAEIAYGRVAHGEAAVHFDRALDAAARLPDLPTAERAGILLRAADAHHWAGNVEEAERRLRTARHLAVARRDMGLLARVALGLGLVVQVGAYGGTNEDALGSLDEALAALPDAPSPLRGALHARISMLSHWSGLGEAAARHADLAARIVSEAGDPMSRALSAMATYLTLVGPEHDADRAGRAERLVAACASTGQWDLELAARMWHITELLASGRADAFRTAVHDCRLRLEQRRHPMAGHLIELLLAHLAGGDVEDAIGTLGARLTESRNPNRATVTLAHGFVLRRDQGRLAELAPLAAAARRAHPNLAFWDVFEAFLAVERRRTDEARARCAAVLADPRLSARADIQWTPTAMLAAEVAAAVGDPELVEAAWSLLRGWSGRHGVFGMPVVYLGPVDHSLGLLAAARGDTDGAIALLTRAERDATRLGAVRAALRSRIARGGIGLPVDHGMITEAGGHGR